MREREKTLDEFGTAGGDEAELSGVVAVLGTKDAGDAEEIAIEAESTEEIAGVVGQTCTLRDAARRRRVFGWRWRRAGQAVGQRGLGVRGGLGTPGGTEGESVRLDCSVGEPAWWVSGLWMSNTGELDGARRVPKWDTV